MSSLAHVSLGVLVGVLFGGLHLLLLRKSIEQALHLATTQASRRVLRGLPLRLCCWIPALVLAARLGFFACVGLVAGSLLIRWTAWLLVGPRCSPTLISRD